MTYDEQHGWVERGTPGVHGGAVVRDVDAEIDTLRKFAAQSYHDGYWWPDMPREMRARRLEELNRHHAEQRDGLHLAHRQLVRDAHPYAARLAASGHVTHKLALLAPYCAVIRAGEAKRQAGRDEQAAWQDERGGVMRVRMDVVVPARVETINVTVNLTADGGEP